MAAGMIAIASIGKFAGAFIGGEIDGLSRSEALALACGMKPAGRLRSSSPALDYRWVRSR
jgi:hypothetical protein